MKAQHRKRTNKVLAGLLLTPFLFFASPSGAQNVFQAVDVFDLTSPGLTGAAWLNRTPDRIQGRLMTGVDESDLAYTLWIVVFNNPGFCVPGQTGPEDLGCNAPDLFNPDVEGSVYYGTGAIAPASDEGGVFNVDFAIRADGKLPDGIFRLDQRALDFWTDGVKKGNGLCAEIHFVVDKHLTPDDKSGGESWVDDLTKTVFPPTGEPSSISVISSRGAVFPPAASGKKCKKRGDDDDSSDD